jgi:uncharacterized membrane protein (GlpM family)
MLKKDSVNIYLLTTVTTLSYVIVIGILDYMRGKFDLSQTVIGAIVFWVVYFITVRLVIRWRQK